MILIETRKDGNISINLYVVNISEFSMKKDKNYSMYHEMNMQIIPFMMDMDGPLIL